jgi:hypothetical protein
MTKEKEYVFKIKTSPKNPNLCAIELQDGTNVVIDGNAKAVSFVYPKKKFSRIFKKQMADKKSRFIGVTWNYTELNALLKGASMLRKNKKEINNETNTKRERNGLS